MRGAIAGIAGAIGLNIDRPAWSEEVKQVANGVRKNSCDILDSKIASIRRQGYANGREQRRYARDRQRVPESLHRERVSLNADAEKLKKQFDKDCLGQKR